MKAIARFFFLALVLGVLATLSYAGPLPPMNIFVTDNAGKVLFTGATKPDGTFASPVLPKGEYVVHLRAKDGSIAKDNFALLARAGRNKVTANALPGSQFTAGGVAMKLKADGGTNITGQVSNVNVAGGTGNAKVKIVNGVRYVWVSSGGLGSNLGGRWVEEGTENSFNRNYLTPDAFARQRDGHGFVDQFSNGR